jgi:crotonobetaine/carnitine-CoA ligase
VADAIPTTESQALRAPLRELGLAEQTVPALLDLQAARHGDKPFVVTTTGEQRSFAGLRDSAAAWAGLFEELGIERGDRVATLVGNRIEAVELLLGCAWMGAVAVPLNAAQRGAQIRHALTGSQARALIIETEHLDALARVPPPASLERVWLLDRERAHRAHGYLCEPLPTPTEQAVRAGVGPGDTFAIHYTSGVGGPARGVCSPHAQLYWAGILGSEFLAITADEVCFTALPLHHPGTIRSLFHALVAGATWVLAPRFNAPRFWRAATEHEATRAYLPAALATQLADQPRSRDDHAHRVKVALGPGVPAALHEPFLERFGVQLLEGYDSTETGRITGVPGEPPRPGSLGRALDEDFEVAVVDSNDAPLPDGEPGELVVRPRHPFSVATGYHDLPDATVDAWRNLWLHTGERVFRDADGFLRIADRVRDAIRRRGEQVSSFEVEQALAEHPSVAAVAVFPVPSELADDEVMAAVVLEPGRDADPLELVAFCEPRLAAFAIPRYIDFVNELPVTTTGTIRRAVLRERGVSHSTWDRERAVRR